jgi:pimeloyl-ACP methyl ester carboxylesterase
MPNTSKPKRAPHTPRPIPAYNSTPLPEVVDPSWILKALGIVFLAAIVCAWMTICFVFSMTQWQIALHPAHDLTTSPAAFGLDFTDVRFATDKTGQPQLDGWFVPAAAPISTTPTVLILHAGSGTMADALPAARLLHDARLNVFLFDYRGFGHSLGQHPTQAFMQADAESALTYLTTTRNLPLTSVIVYGTGLGGSIAVQLASDHQAIPALILDTPDGDLLPRAQAQVRSRLVPVRLLFHDDFPLAAQLQTLHTPKLLITHTNAAPPQVFQQAADPKLTVEFPSNDPTTYAATLHRFLDTYIPR